MPDYTGAWGFVDAKRGWSALAAIDQLPKRLKGRTPSESESGVDGTTYVLRDDSGEELAVWELGKPWQVTLIRPPIPETTEVPVAKMGLPPKPKKKRKKSS